MRAETGSSPCRFGTRGERRKRGVGGRGRRPRGGGRRPSPAAPPERPERWKKGGPDNQTLCAGEVDAIIFEAAYPNGLTQEGRRRAGAATRYRIACRARWRAPAGDVEKGTARSGCAWGLPSARRGAFRRGGMAL